MRSSDIIRFCSEQLDRLPTRYPRPASRCAAKTRHLIQLQGRIIQAYNQSQFSSDDLHLANQLIVRISGEFKLK